MANPFARAVQLATFTPTGMKGGVTTSQLLPTYKDNTPQFSEWKTEKAVDEGFKASSWVYSCTFRLMQSVASVPWKVYQLKGKDEWEPIPEHPLEALLERPNPFMSREDLMQRLTAQMYLGGNAMLSKIKKGNIIVELWPIDVGNIAVVPSRTKFISHYEYEADGTKVIIKPDDVMHSMFVDPANPYWGMSPMQAISRTIDTDNEAIKWNMIALQNRAVSDGVFIFEQSLTREQWDEARDRFRESYQGAENARTPLIIGGKAVWQPMSMSPAEMDFLKSRAFTREEIAAAFGVPLPMIGIYEHATLANIETARRIFWIDTVIPFMEGIRAAINRSLVPHFGDPARLWIDFDLSDVDAVREDYAKKVETAEKMWKMGVPLNVVIQKTELDIDPIDGSGDIAFIPTTMQAVDVALAVDSEDDPGSGGGDGGDPEEDELEGPKGPNTVS